MKRPTSPEALPGAAEAPGAGRAPDAGASTEGSAERSGAASHRAGPTEGPEGDRVLIHAVADGGAGFHVLRSRHGVLEAGLVRPLRHGQPIHGEVVRLRPRPEFPLLCDVTEELSAPPASERRASDVQAPAAARLTSHGPAQVASDDYRRNWDAIWSVAPRKPSSPS